MEDHRSSPRNVAAIDVEPDVAGGAAVDAFKRPLAEFDALSCWGELWSRPGLDARERSLLSVAVVASHSRLEELGTHIRGALRSGCTVVEIQEVLLQAGAHGGRRTVHESFGVLRSLLAAPGRRFPARQQLAG